MILDDLKESDKQLLYELFNEVEYMYFRTDLEDAAKNLAYKEKMLLVTVLFTIVLFILLVWIYIDRKVREKLYLNYQLQRDDYAEIMGVDKNRFASIIKESTGNNLNTYLNDIRLEYSVYLFRNKHPEMSIFEVGEACALPSFTTFYRLFKEKYGISPKTFKERKK